MGLNTYTTPSSPVKINAMNGGLNSSFSPLNVEDNECSAIQNIDFDQSGSILKRNGYIKLNSATINGGAVGNGLFFFDRVNPGESSLIGCFGNKVYSDCRNAVPVPFTQAVTAGANIYYDFDVFLNTLLLTNNEDQPMQIDDPTDPTSMTAMNLGSTGITKAKFVKVFQNYPFLFNLTDGVGAKPSRAQWAQIDTIATWPAENFREVGLDDGQSITGAEVLGDRLCVFKNRSIWLGFYTGNSVAPFVWRKSSSSVGCIAGGSITIARNGIIFQSQDGFYLFDGETSEKISYRISNTLTAGYNSSRFQYTQAVYNQTKNVYVTTMSTLGNTIHNSNVVYDTFNNAFSIYSGLQANFFATSFASGTEIVYFCDFFGNVYQMDVPGANDNPAGVEIPIDAYWRSKWYDFGDASDTKGNPRMILYYDLNNRTTVNFGYSFNFSNVLTDYLVSDQYNQNIEMFQVGSLWDVGEWDEAVWGSAGSAVQRRSMAGKGYVIRLTFRNAGFDQFFKIHGFGLSPYLESYK